MADKNLEDLIVKIVKKVIRKEIKNLSQDNLPIVLTDSMPIWIIGKIQLLQKN
jgi:hypothetical protein